jgi:prepilin peptidase CpaA
MNANGIISQGVLVGLLLWAAVLDLKTRKIPNWLTFTLIGLGLIASFLPVGLIGPGEALVGMFAGLALPFVLFAIGALGAGDVKLMAGIGACLGAKAAVAIFTAAMVVALVIVVGQAVVQGKLMALLKNSALLVLMVVNIRQLGAKHISESGKQCRSVGKPLPYAVPILIATVAMLVAPGLMRVI